VSKELSILIPTEIFKLRDEKVVSIDPFTFKQFPVALGILEKYFMAFSGEITTDSIVVMVFDKINEDYSLLKDLCTLIKLCTKLEDADLDGIAYDEVFSIFTVIVRQNMDFFNRIGKTLNPQREEEKTSAQLEMTGDLKLAA
jgi:hypothetical protein